MKDNSATMAEAMQRAQEAYQDPLIADGRLEHQRDGTWLYHDQSGLTVRLDRYGNVVLGGEDPERPRSGARVVPLWAVQIEADEDKSWIRELYSERQTRKAMLEARSPAAFASLEAQADREAEAVADMMGALMHKRRVGKMDAETRALRLALLAETFMLTRPDLSMMDDLGLWLMEHHQNLTSDERAAGWTIRSMIERG